jgi:hypothetical protein
MAENRSWSTLKSSLRHVATLCAVIGFAELTGNRHISVAGHAPGSIPLAVRCQLLSLANVRKQSNKIGHANIRPCL